MADPIDPRTLEVLAEVSTSDKKAGDPILTTLSTGVVLRHKKFSLKILVKLDEKYTDIPVPKVYDADGDRWIENPDDPQYEKDVAALAAKKNDEVLNLMVALGTEIEFIPEGVQSPDDTEWVDELSFVGIDVPSLRLGRLLYWVNYYAAQTIEDFQNLANNGGTVLGIRETQVAEQISGFKSDEERRPDTDSSTEV